MVLCSRHLSLMTSRPNLNLIEIRKSLRIRVMIHAYYHAFYRYRLELWIELNFSSANSDLDNGMHIIAKHLSDPNLSGRQLHETSVSATRDDTTSTSLTEDAMDGEMSVVRVRHPS